MAISPLNKSFGLTANILQLRAQMDGLQTQLATGKKSQTYAGLGHDRVLSLSLRARISAVDGYRDTIQLVQVRLDALQTNLDRFRDIAAETRSDTLVDNFELLPGNQTQAQQSAGFRLDEAVALLNLELAGRYSFGGRDTVDPPVRTPDQILNGEGGRAGLLQMLSERRQADLGDDGRGRLDVGPAAGATVALAEDGAGHPFGFKLTAITSTLTGTTVNPPAGAPPSLDVTFTATLPQPGESVRITLALPDGSEEVIELTATDVAPAGAGEFLIGVDENATAANFETALAASVETLAATALEAASSTVAADNFFDFDDANPPQRVDGPPFDTATALIDATTANTTFWYTGDASTASPRDSAIAKVDDSLNVAYGVRADEGPLRSTIKALAMFSAITFSPSDTNSEARYEALSDRIGDILEFPGTTKSINDLIGELGFKQKQLQDADERHTTSNAFSQSLLDETESADIAEIGAKLISLETRLQASYQTVSTLSQLTIVNFLPR